MSDPATPVRPTAAGMYDFYLGGTAHSEADRRAGEAITKILPEAVDAAWANRGFLQRAVKRMAAEWGVRQFLDIGAGLPTQHNTHDVVAEVTPDGRVVYVDHDPVVVTRAQELLVGLDRAVAIQGDLREPESILEHPETRRLLDFTRPIGLLMVAVLHFVPDDADPWGLVARYVDALPSGSYLALSHGTADYLSEQRRNLAMEIYRQTPNPPVDRTRTEVQRFFTGLELAVPYEGAKPELTFAAWWGAEDPVAADSEGARGFYAGVGRKP